MKYKIVKKMLWKLIIQLYSENAENANEKGKNQDQEEEEEDVEQEQEEEEDDQELKVNKDERKLPVYNDKETSKKEGKNK